MIINGFGGSAAGSITGSNQLRIIRNYSGDVLYSVTTTAAVGRSGFQDYYDSNDAVTVGSYTCPANTTFTLSNTSGTSGTNLFRYVIYKTLTLDIPESLYGVSGFFVFYFTDTSGNTGTSLYDLWTLSNSNWNTTNSAYVMINTQTLYNYPLWDGRENIGVDVTASSSNYRNFFMANYNPSTSTNYIYTGTMPAPISSTAHAADANHPMTIRFYHAVQKNNYTDAGSVTITNKYTWTVAAKFFHCRLY